ncbi:MAG TPA: capsule assembly Wzi family protein, partial [Longimicrobiales bacterium]|nr:capsule assembly Wzi family protein [Longimicrobiales bacterium]
MPRRRIRIILAAASAAATFGPAPLGAQSAPPRPAACEHPVNLELTSVDDFSADLARVLEITGAAPLRVVSVRRLSRGSGLRLCADGRDMVRSALLPPAADPTGATLIRVLPAVSSTELNSAYPLDRDNGVLWAGRGVSSAISAGVGLHWGVLSAALAPALVYQQNLDFETVPVGVPGYSRYANPWHTESIDWPQRFGADPYWTIDPGQSFVRIDYRGAELGVSNENLWWGPGRLNSIVLGASAPGFPHVFLGTSRPLNVGIGRVDGELIWGHLAESDSWDADPTNDRRLFAGVVLGLEPRGLPGLTLGFTRAYLETIPPGGLSLLDYLRRPYAHPRANPTGPIGGNQLVSLFGRWALPASGFEAYAEWARDDNWDTFHDLLLEPEHSQGYTLGFQKVVPAGPRSLRLFGELTHLETSTSLRSGRGAVTFYLHSQVRQGYTQRGQLLGASIGPGSNAAAIGADLFAGRSVTGLALARIAHDNDAYYGVWARTYGFRGHDVELAASVRHQRLLGPLTLDGELGLSTRYNRDFLDLSEDYTVPRRVDHNLH